MEVKKILKEANAWGWEGRCERGTCLQCLHDGSMNDEMYGRAMNDLGERRMSNEDNKCE